MSARRRRRPDLRLTVACDVIAETDNAIVMRLEKPAAGSDGHVVKVMLEPDVSIEHAATILRELAPELGRAVRSDLHRAAMTAPSNRSGPYAGTRL